MNLPSALLVLVILTLQTAARASAPTIDELSLANDDLSESSLPAKIYGVNLGSWLVIEPSFMINEWLAMGGEQCDDCSKCIHSEFAFSQAYPDSVDQKFKEHWLTWFTQADVDAIRAAGINTVRIPLGYWIVEPLVNRGTEHYARGGIVELVRGLSQLNSAGIMAILDHHALPGVASPNQMFTGRCTTDVQFYTLYNYRRALVWAAVMASLTHLHPEFASIVAIQAINEPIMDARQTPGLGNYYKNFVKTIRAVEYCLGVPVRKMKPGYCDIFNTLNLSRVNATASISFAIASLPNIFDEEVITVLEEAVPVLQYVAAQLRTKLFRQYRKPLVTNMMDMSWQYNSPTNPADAAIGPQTYDNHLYYSFGGVADANEHAYLTHICNLDRVQSDAARGNYPLWFGEWSLATQFNATDEFLKKWADAQKLQYSRSAGWIFWNWKAESSALAHGSASAWSYQLALRHGYFMQDPAEYHDPEVCKAYVK